MERNPLTITRAFHLMIVCRCLERIADHATNLAEDVIFMLDARVISIMPMSRKRKGEISHE